MHLYKILLLAALLLTGCSSDEEQKVEQQPVEEARSTLDPGDAEIAEIIEPAVFRDLDGNDVTLEKFRGKVVLIDFWETWCGPCLQVFPSMQELLEEFPDRFEVLAVTLGATEGPEDAKAFRDKHNYDFNYLFDRHGVSSDLGIYSIPYKIFIGPDGKMIKQDVGLVGGRGDYEETKAIILEYSK